MRWTTLPPRPAVRAALGLGGAVVSAAALASWLGGGEAAIGVVLGVAGGLQPAVVAVPRPTRLLLAAAVPVAAWLGVVAAGHPVWAGLAVAGLTLLQWPAGPRVGGALAFLPIIAALGASVGLPSAESFAMWTAVGVALISLLAAASRLQAPVAAIPVHLARRHALVTAAATAAALYLCLENGVTHGYWLVVTLVLVLRPMPGETTAGARDRTLGTLAGAAVAIAAVITLPAALIVVFLVACLVLTLAWAVAKDVRRQTLYSTPIVILAGSSGVAGTSVGVALERLLFTVAAALIAVVLAGLLHWWDIRVPRGLTPSR
jgi:Fusaric acid resistance protein-like